MADMLLLSGAITAIILTVAGGMIFSFLMGARVYRAGRENYPVNVIEMPGENKKDQEEKDRILRKGEEWDNG
jgi:hypothetical protein